MEETEGRLYLTKAKKYIRDEIDSSFLDRMKDRPIEWRMASYNRGIFESWIVQSTPDEPEAPPITVKNLIDDEPCPVWEFFYTNKFVRGDGVPKPPSPDQRTGCSCIGGCKDDSSSCACALAQEKYGKEYDVQGFLYDQDGCLKFIGPPILECNEACSCADYCVNRVAGRGRRYRVEIRKTEKTGWGVFAGENIPSGSFLGVYAGELLLDAEGEARGQRFYNLYNRTYLFSIDWYYIRDLCKERKEEFSTQYVIDAMHVGCFTRFLNHSCDPNCSEVPCVFGDAELEIPYLAFFTKRDIKKDEEITFCYRGSQDTYTTREELARAKKRAEEKRLKAHKGRAKQVDVPCQCGSWNCLGSIWKWESSDEEDE
ncbi:SET domain-containing protein [Serendipita vermifera]|nr:SET domain-containing protein [Serendipita vermifera]